MYNDDAQATTLLLQAERFVWKRYLPRHSIIILCTGDILQDIEFTSVTGHKGLENALTQRILSGRQARWMEKLSGFDFAEQYMPGEENALLNA